MNHENIGGNNEVETTQGEQNGFAKIAEEMPSFEEHMQEMNSQSQSENMTNIPEWKKNKMAVDQIERRFDYIASNKEKYGQAFDRLNSEIQEEYEDASSEYMEASGRAAAFRMAEATSTRDKEAGTKTYYDVPQEDGTTETIVTPLKVPLDFDENHNLVVANKEDFMPGMAEKYEAFISERIAAYVDADQKEQAKNVAEAKLNILNFGFAGADYKPGGEKVEGRELPEDKPYSRYDLVMRNSEGMTLEQYLEQVTNVYGQQYAESRKRSGDAQRAYNAVVDESHTENPFRKEAAEAQLDDAREEMKDAVEQLKIWDAYSQAAKELLGSLKMNKK